MVAHYHPWMLPRTALEEAVRRALGRSRGVVLAMMVRQLQPWHENIGKRQVKSPKICFRDTGLLHALLDGRVGVEFKRVDAPRITPSMRIAIEDLKLDALYVVYPGSQRNPLADGIAAVPLWALLPAG